MNVKGSKASSATQQWMTIQNRKPSHAQRDVALEILWIGHRRGMGTASQHVRLGSPRRNDHG
jgi:hypothetical protein